VQGRAGASDSLLAGRQGRVCSVGSAAAAAGGLASSLFAAVLSIPHALAEADCVSEFVCPQFGLLPARARE
jgi:ABC-type phosphate transport system permease subunit